MGALTENNSDRKGNNYILSAFHTLDLQFTYLYTHLNVIPTRKSLHFFSCIPSLNVQIMTKPQCKFLMSTHTHTQTREVKSILEYLDVDNAVDGLR